MNFVKLACGSSRRRRKLSRRGLGRHVKTNKELIIAEFELQIVPKKPSGNDTID